MKLCFKSALKLVYVDRGEERREGIKGARTQDWGIAFMLNASG